MSARYHPQTPSSFYVILQHIHRHYHPRTPVLVHVRVTEKFFPEIRHTFRVRFQLHGESIEFHP